MNLIGKTHQGRRPARNSCLRKQFTRSINGAHGIWYGSGRNQSPSGNHLGQVKNRLRREKTASRLRSVTIVESWLAEFARARTRRVAMRISRLCRGILGIAKARAS